MANLLLRIKDNEIDIEAEGSLLDITANWAYLTKELRSVLQRNSEEDMVSLFRTALEFSELYKSPKERRGM